MANKPMYQYFDKIIKENKKGKYKNVAMLVDMLDSTQHKELVEYLKPRATNENIKNTLVRVLLLINL